MLVHYIVFPVSQSTIGTQLSLLATTFRLPQERKISIIAAGSVSAFHLLLIFACSSNVVEANIHRLLKTTILTLRCSQHTHEHSNDMREFSAIWGPQKIFEFAVLIRMNSTSPFSWSSFPIEPLSFTHHRCMCQSNKLWRPSRLGNKGVKDVKIQTCKSCKIPAHLATELSQFM